MHRWKRPNGPDNATPYYPFINCDCSETACISQKFDRMCRIHSRVTEKKHQRDDRCMAFFHRFSQSHTLTRAIHAQNHVFNVKTVDEYGRAVHHDEHVLAVCNVSSARTFQRHTRTKTANEGQPLAACRCVCLNRERFALQPTTYEPGNWIDAK